MRAYYKDAQDLHSARLRRVPRPVSRLRSMCASSESMLGSKSIFNSVHLRWSSGKAAALRLASSSVAEASCPPAHDERLAIDDGSER